MKKSERFARVIAACENEHRRFVDFMYSRYGLDEHPGYCEVRMREMFPSGTYEHNPLLINLSEDGFTTIPSHLFTTAHESSHFLHDKINSKRFEKTMADKNYAEYFVDEVIANLGAFIYLDEQRGGLSQRRIRGFAGKDVKRDKRELVPLIIAIKDKSILVKIVDKNTHDAIQIIKPFMREARLYAKSICDKYIPSKDKEVDDFSFQGQPYQPHSYEEYGLDNQLEFSF
ncbi:MAG: hypothetical protein AABX93_02830 [Nanoarchaeota archaeon]